MDPYKTSYRNKFPLHLNTNFYMIESDRESHLEGGVLNLQLSVSKSIHPFIYGIAAPSVSWPPSEDPPPLHSSLSSAPLLHHLTPMIRYVFFRTTSFHHVLGFPTGFVL